MPKRDAHGTVFSYSGTSRGRRRIKISSKNVVLKGFLIYVKEWQNKYDLLINLQLRKERSVKFLSTPVEHFITLLTHPVYAILS